ncbi:MAG TPA: rubrerythrin family protein [Candidatus Sumerlaeota bacterium]|nr:rubrerythrin family protein [Candidatus Sumerlaeota bacterium]
MKQMTTDNLAAAYAGESQAHMKYAIFADVAEKEGMADIARMFKAISYAELVHARNHLRELKKIKTTAENLQTAIGGETYEVDEMYPAFIEVAKLQDEKGAVRSFNFAIQAEKIHAVMYEKARLAAEAGNDFVVGRISICPTCGYTHYEGDMPDFCPVCGVPKDKFVAF